MMINKYLTQFDEKRSKDTVWKRSDMVGWLMGNKDAEEIKDFLRNALEEVYKEGLNNRTTVVLETKEPMEEVVKIEEVDPLIREAYAYKKGKEDGVRGFSEDCERRNKRVFKGLSEGTYRKVAETYLKEQDE